MSKQDVRFSLLLAFAAILTIGIKVRVAAFGYQTDSAVLTRAIEADLVRKGFNTRLEAHTFQSVVIDAVRGGCHLRVRDGMLSDQYGKIFASQTGGLGPVRYVYRGTWTDSPPLFWPGLERYVVRMRARLGFSAQFQTTLAVAERGCEPAMLDFTAITQEWLRK